MPFPRQSLLLPGSSTTFSYMPPTETVEVNRLAIEEILEREHLNRSQLAARAGVSTGLISDILNGRTIRVSLPTIAKIAGALNVRHPGALYARPPADEIIATEGAA